MLLCPGGFTSGYLRKELHFITPELSEQNFPEVGLFSGLSARCIFKGDPDVNIKLRPYVSTWKSDFEKRKTSRHE